MKELVVASKALWQQDIVDNVDDTVASHNVSRNDFWHLVWVTRVAGSLLKDGPVGVTDSTSVLSTSHGDKIRANQVACEYRAWNNMVQQDAGQKINIGENGIKDTFWKSGEGCIGWTVVYWTKRGKG